jgi:predicted alpha/beta hydrolase family esterase
MNADVFILPGLNNSGPDHWQTQWETHYGFKRVNQQEWDRPRCEDWINRIEEVLSSYKDENILLVGHSLACCTIVHWSNKFRRKIKGALLVGPSDVEAPSYPEGTIGFAPMPLDSLPFPTIVIASSNDEYVSLERANYFARHWQSQLVNIGPLGHINSASGLGLWPAGFSWLKKLDNTEI